MIPKVIHYCWFGGQPLTERGLKCIESWQKMMPDYKIKRWDESNFDYNSIPYTAEAYKAKKYAFVSDYARFKIIYENGGIYFDTDVELIKSINDMRERGAFMGCERESIRGFAPELLKVAPGLGIGAEAGHPFYKKMLNFYENLNFKSKEGKIDSTTVVKHTSKLLANEGLQNKPEIQYICGIFIYPKEYLCPMDTGTREITITENTRSIHYYDGSWTGTRNKFKTKLKKILGKRTLRLAVNCKRKLGY